MKINKILLLSCLFSVSSYAEISIGLGAGLADYTTKVRGDAVYSYNVGTPGYTFKHEGDINNKDFAGGGSLRLLKVFDSNFGMGIEGGYTFLSHNKKVVRSNDVEPAYTARDVETFQSSSKGFIFGNAMLQYRPFSVVGIAVFGGPAWLDTAYADRDIFNGIANRATHKYKITTNLGAEIDVYFKSCWSLGLRYDYLFDTKNRTVAVASSEAAPLIRPTTAKSGLTAITATFRYDFGRAIF